MSEVKKLSGVTTATEVSSLMAILTDTNGNLSKTASGNLSQVGYKGNTENGAAIASGDGLNLVFVYSTSDITKYWIGFFWRFSLTDYRCVEVVSNGITIVWNGQGTIAVNNGVSDCVYRAYNFKPSLT